MLLLSHLCLGILDRPTQWTGLAVCSPKVETHQNYSIKVQLTHLTLAIPSHSVWAIGLGIPITQNVHADHVETGVPRILTNSKVKHNMADTDLLVANALQTNICTHTTT